MDHVGTRRILYHLAACPELVGDLVQVGPEATTRFALKLLREIGTGDGFAVAVSTESRVNNTNLRMLPAVPEHAELSVIPEVIE